MLALLLIGLAEAGLPALAAVVALLSAFLVLRADLRRRRLPVRPAAMFISVLLRGMLGAKIFSVLEARAGQGAHSAANLLGLTALRGSEVYSGACRRSGFWRATTMGQS